MLLLEHVRRLARPHSFDDPCFGPLEMLDLESFAAKMVERLPQQMVGFQARVDRFEQPLSHANDRVRAAVEAR